MSGIKYLLDTNVVIGLLNGSSASDDLRRLHDLRPDNSAVSQITKIELLGYPQLTISEEKTIQLFLNEIIVIGIDAATEATTIALRKIRKTKLPDALITATAAAKGLQLLSLELHKRTSAKTCWSGW